MTENKQGFKHYTNWYKGNLHSHTTNSDGNLSPEEAVKLFKEHGYSFLCFSEHDLYTDLREKFDCDDFIILPGLEASAVLYEAGTGRALKVHHIHGILGTEEMEKAAGDRVFRNYERLEPDRYEGEWNGAEAAQKLCDYLRSRGCITTYNHPIWSRVDADEFIHTEGIWALEIFNYNTVNESNTGFDSTYWDLMLRHGRKMLGIATDDNHNGGVFDDACGGFIVVNAPELSHEAILKNMLEGNYYMSAGPEIHDWKIQDGVAYVECSPVYRIDFIAGNHINDGISYVGKCYEDTIVKGEYDLKGDEDYVRVQCTDKYGRTAWSNPLFLR
ncbi:MAG: PHP domain-containing protein [Lachnospiraceae bacterium]|nr:PHP domain-containing protein [Lachnospiraceae bacterium]